MGGQAAVHALLMYTCLRRGADVEILYLAGSQRCFENYSSMDGGSAGDSAGDLKEPT
jgi:hypothetical protein